MIAAADNIDVVVMLLYDYQNQISNIYFLQKGRKDAGVLKKHLTKLHAKNSCFWNAWSGCDTTSSVFGKGEVTFMKMV